MSSTNTPRRHARAMDLPGYCTPPRVRDIATHAGSWGWTESHHVAQDDEGRLWADGTAHPKAAPSAPRNLQRLLTWSEHGLAVYVPRDGYRLLERIDGPVDERWVPIASVMPELPAYARDE
ncbi:hypothetical protein FHS39_002550 [Streptomyces olivoverticillatus]|uniref:Uncharacterized protein n=1 Tax=Streptomyces olivoverticillatus TaxID=66427 RepID=A0A7W7LNS3_9ACTN|nr:hypothetical protein [Streptomyces olivoverticillatus]